MKAHKFSATRAFMEIMVALLILATINLDTNLIDAIRICFEQSIVGNTNFSYVKEIILDYFKKHFCGKVRLFAVLFCKFVWSKTSFHDDEIGYFSLFALLTIATVYFLYKLVEGNVNTINGILSLVRIRVRKCREGNITSIICYLLDLKEIYGESTNSEVRRYSYKYALIAYYDDS